jgi:putative PEP-CTERM system TPR-repeat lipoprotein
MQRHATKLKLSAALVSGAFTLVALSGCGHSESTATLLAEAQQYQQKGDLKGALIQLKNAVEKSPEDGEARFQLGSLEMEMRDVASAEKELRKARSLGIPTDRVLPLLGKVDLQQGHFKELLEDIPAEQAAKSALLLALRGDALIATGKPAEAKQAYDQALALNPNQGEALLGLARHAMSQHDRDGAFHYLDEAVAKDAKNPEIWMTRGVVMRMEGRVDDALAAYDQVLKLKPDHFSAHVEKAYIEIARGQFPAAKTEIETAEKISPNNMLVTYTRALYEFSQGKHAAAHEALLKVLKNAPDHMPSILLAGAAELSLGSTQQAEQHLRKYLESNPDNVYARKLLAQAQLKSAQPADAAATLAPVLKDSIQDPQLLALAGASYMQTRDFDKASNYLEKAAALAPKAVGVRTSLGIAKLAQGQEARGLSELETATTLDPKSIQAAMALIQTEMHLKHYDKALAAVQNLEKQQPGNPQVQNVKGAVYVVKGDAASARAAFEKALALQSSFFPATVNLARLDIQDKKPDAARQRFEKLLETDKNNASAMAALGELAMSQKRADEATSWFEKASNVNPDAIAPAITLGTHYLRTNQPQKALTLARKFQTANPTNPDVLELLGQAQVVNKDLTGALDTYGKLVNVLPKSAQAQLRLAGVHMLMKNESAAADDLKRAVDLQPDFVPARLAQIDLALRNKRFDDALAMARKIQSLNEKSPVGFAVEGDVLVAQGKPAQAVGAYDKALTLALGKDFSVVLKAAQAENAAGKHKEAQARLGQWMKANPNDLGAALAMSELQLVGKDYKAAIATLEDVQKRAPNNVLVLNNLAYAYQQQKDPRALATAEQAYKLASDNAQVADTLAWMLLEQGNTARALPLLQKAVTTAPNAAEIRYHYAVGLQKSGDKLGARKELDKLLAENKNFPQAEEARALLKTL